MYCLLPISSGLTFIWTFTTLAKIIPIIFWCTNANFFTLRQSSLDVAISVTSLNHYFEDFIILVNNLQNISVTCDRKPKLLHLIIKISSDLLFQPYFFRLSSLTSPGSPPTSANPLHSLRPVPTDTLHAAGPDFTCLKFSSCWCVTFNGLIRYCFYCYPKFFNTSHVCVLSYWNLIKVTSIVGISVAFNIELYTDHSASVDSDVDIKELLLGQFSNLLD